MDDLMCCFCGSVFSEVEGVITADWYWREFGIDLGDYACPVCDAGERYIVEL